MTPHQQKPITPATPATPAPAVPWTAERVRTLPDDERRYELIDGELVVANAPRMRHQRMVAALVRILDPYIHRRGLGELLWPPSDIAIGHGSLTQPDLFVVPRACEERIEEWSDVTSLLLAIEVVAPRTARTDRGRKRQYYQRHRTPEYWVIDAQARVIERWRAEATRAEVEEKRLCWHPEGVSDALEIDLVALFDDARGPRGERSVGCR